MSEPSMRRVVLKLSGESFAHAGERGLELGARTCVGHHGLAEMPEQHQAQTAIQHLLVHGHELEEACGRE